MKLTWIKNLVSPYKILISKKFSIILVLALLFGYIPVNFASIFAASEVFEPPSPFYKNIMIYYSVGVFILRSYAYFAAGWLKLPDAKHLFAFIIQHLFFFSWILVEFLTRLYMIYHPLLTVQMLKALRKLSNRLPESKCSERISSLPNMLASLVIALNVSAILYFSTLRLLEWLFSIGDKLFWKYLVYPVTSAFCSSVLSLLEIAFILLLGVHLINNYWKLVQHGFLENEYPAKEFLKYYKTLQKCLDLYNRFVGIFVLTSISQNSVAALYDLYYVSVFCDNWTSSLIFFMLSLLYFVSLFAVVYFGQYTQNIMKMTGKRVGIAMVDLKLQRTGRIAIQEKIAIAKYILAYKWKMNACGLFDINFKLFPTVASFLPL